MYRKTEAGREEISQRTRKLPTQLRTILLMVDGQRTPAQLRALINDMKAPPDTLEQLALEGLIELVPAGFNAAGVVDVVTPRGGAAAPEPGAAEAAAVATAEAQAAADAQEADDASAAQSGKYILLYEKMSEAVRAHLGLRGYFMQLKIERCTTADELEELLPEFREALAKAKGETFASDWLRALSPVAS
ncbi:hypothetical protein [Pseudoxanthomonas suwonensis]|uniref:hypothetical protein n=1 Tax=Pseudoxanthomonas suwonensis TaxID=314722 RepID=UPI001E2DE04B|nr:hypothetical protein [Pseudoxanthomonas suwonensis]